MDAYRAKDTKQFDYWSERFLQLIKDQNELLSTHECFFVGRWLDMARSKSKQPELQDLYEHNARMLIGTWTETLSRCATMPTRKGWAAEDILSASLD